MGDAYAGGGDDGVGCGSSLTIRSVPKGSGAGGRERPLEWEMELELGIESVGECEVGLRWEGCEVEGDEDEAMDCA